MLAVSYVPLTNGANKMKTLDVLTDMYHGELDCPDSGNRVVVLKMMIDLLNELPDNPVVQKYLTVHEKVDNNGDSRYYYGIDKSVAIGEIVETDDNEILELTEIKFNGNEYDGDPDFDEFVFNRLRDDTTVRIFACEMTEKIIKNLTTPDKLS